MENKSDEGINIDFVTIDASIEKFVLALAEWNKKRNINNYREQKPKTKRVIKKLNVELIKKVLQETQELQRKKNKKNED